MRHDTLYAGAVRTLATCMAVMLLAVLSVHAQTGKKTVCQNDTEEYSMYVGTSCSRAEWLVTDGVFPEHNNGQTATPTIDGSGYTKVKVKWTGSSIGTLVVSGCETGQLDVSIYAVPFSVTASATSILLTGIVTLTAHPNNNAPQFTWSQTPNGGLLSTTGPVVQAQPVAKSTYTATGSQVMQLGSGNMTCTNTKTIVVDVLVPPIEGNVICCTHCVLPNITPDALTQASGTALSGGNGKPFVYKWQRSTDGLAFSDVGNTGLSYTPPAGTQTYWYRRAVSNDRYPEVQNYSNAVTVAVANTNTTLQAANYPIAALRVARQTLTIQGNQSTTGDAIVELRASNQVVVKPGTILYPNVALIPFTDCVAVNRRMAADDTSTASLTDTKGEDFVIYPNPAQHTTVVQYTVSTIGSLRVTLLDAVGTPVKVFANEANAEPGVYQHTFDASALHPGLYYLVRETPLGRYVKRVSIKR